MNANGLIGFADVKMPLETLPVPVRDTSLIEPKVLDQGGFSSQMKKLSQADHAPKAAKAPRQDSQSVAKNPATERKEPSNKATESQKTRQTVAEQDDKAGQTPEVAEAANSAQGNAETVNDPAEVNLLQHIQSILPAQPVEADQAAEVDLSADVLEQEGSMVTPDDLVQSDGQKSGGEGDGALLAEQGDQEPLPIEGRFASSFREKMLQNQIQASQNLMQTDSNTETANQSAMPAIELLGAGKILQQVSRALPEAASAGNAGRSVFMDQPFGSPEWGKQLGQKISMLLKDQVEQASIRLNPIHLGPIEVKLQTQQEQATLMLNAQHSLTREALEQALPRLKEMLQESGYTSVNAQVSQESFKEQTSNDTQRTADGRSDGQRKGAGSADEDEAIESTAVIRLNPDRAVDYFA